MEIVMRMPTLPRLPTLWLAALLASAPFAALAVDNSISRDAPDLTSVPPNIKPTTFPPPLPHLPPPLETPQHADIHNLTGFSLRKTGDYKQAYTFYQKALDFDATHKGAHEYLGELYVETGQMAKAKGELAALVKLCPSGCEELDDLQA